MYIPHFQWLEARQDPPPPGAQKNVQDQGSGSSGGGDGSVKVTVGIVVAAVFAFLVIAGVIFFFILRILRRMNYRPRFIPGQTLKGKWNRWNVGRPYGQVPNSSSPNQMDDTRYHGAGHGTGAIPRRTGSEMNTTTNGLRRDTSVRSVISLPPYSASPKPEEQIIAREGERSGMDVVVEFPETAEEEEARREELMEALYQIRLQRRQDNADREARRQARRDARAQGNFIRLEELRLQSVVRRDRGRSASANPAQSASALLAEHQSRGRERRIASVNYAALGRVRHDGSRLRIEGNRMRTDSADSDNRPLLEEGSGDGVSHHRGSSYSSLVSGSSVASDDQTLTPVASQRQSEHSARSRSNSFPTSIPEEDDVGEADSPPPPEYEFAEWGEAPSYSSPHAARFPSGERDAESSNGQMNTRNEQGTDEQDGNNEAHPQSERSQPPAPLSLLTPTPLPQIQIQLPSPIGTLSPIGDLTPTTPTHPLSREQRSEHEHSAEQSQDGHNATALSQQDS